MSSSPVPGGPYVLSLVMAFDGLYVLGGSYRLSLCLWSVLWYGDVDYVQFISVGKEEAFF